MRNFYKHNNDESVASEVIMSSDGQSEEQIVTSVADAQVLVDNGEAVLYDSHQAFGTAMKYASDRRNDYPTIEEQLDQMYHEGLDAWKETIQAVKDAHPKP